MRFNTWEDVRYQNLRRGINEDMHALGRARFSARSAAIRDVL